MAQLLQNSEAHGLSAGVAVGELVFADASAIDLDTMRRVPQAGALDDEVRIVLERLQAILAEADSSLADIVKVSAYLAADSDREAFWTAYDRHFPAGPKPVRLTQVTGLDGDARVALDVVAMRRRQ